MKSYLKMLGDVLYPIGIVIAFILAIKVLEWVSHL